MELRGYDILSVFAIICFFIIAAITFTSFSDQANYISDFDLRSGIDFNQYLLNYETSPMLVFLDILRVALLIYLFVYMVFIVGLAKRIDESAIEIVFLVIFGLWTAQFITLIAYFVGYRRKFKKISLSQEN